MVFTKWLVLSMYVLILTYLVLIAYSVVSGGGPVGGVISFVQYAIYAFLQTWIFWYAFAKREPPCCFVCIEDFKPMHLIMGLLLVLSGVLNAVNAVLSLLNLMALGTGTAFIVYAVFVVFNCLYALCMCGVGLCLIKMGGKKMDIETGGAQKVGA